MTDRAHSFVQVGCTSNIKFKNSQNSTILIAVFIVMAIIPILTLILIQLIKHSSGCYEETELILVSAIFRHGARTTYRFYSTDPYKNETFYPIGLGGLTNKGKMQEMNLGKFLRHHYGNFLGDYYTEEKVYVRSTDVNRCKMSAQLVLAGLFPPQNEQIWNEYLNWQPIPVQFKEKSHEDLLHPSDNCPYKEKILKDLMNHQEIREKYFDHYKSVHDYIQTYSGSPMFNPEEAYEFFFIIESETNMDLPVPDWVYEIYPQPLETIASVVYSYHNSDLLVKQINAGYLLKKIIEDSLRKINGSDPDRKMYLYSGHESTVGYMLDALNILQPHIPKISSALLFELHKKENEFFIKIRYRNNTNADEPVDMVVPGCNCLCPLDEFVRLYNSIIPKKTIQEVCENDFI